ncbi:hypothetical protein L3Y34_006760 [Caenorhabditis briggsae]|uniref:Uncharacterized protein n=1 Tax=Caenorhabditis briggsae TaxID=6238 RepID=A0AAE9CYU7_CAEBR|nr:hypothetical protein L3Y34_006760 [Caenorhabditis briggsae]
MCCKRKKSERQAAGKCHPMEIDGGPPPFIGSTSNADVEDDDGFSKNPYDEDDVDESSSPDTTSSNLPLPHDPSRSRSVSPIVKTAISSSPEAPQTMSEVQKVVDDDEDDEWGDFGEAVVAAAPIQNTVSLSKCALMVIHCEDR